MIQEHGPFIDPRLVLAFCAAIGIAFLMVMGNAGCTVHASDAPAREATVGGGELSTSGDYDDDVELEYEDDENLDAQIDAWAESDERERELRAGVEDDDDVYPDDVYGDDLYRGDVYVDEHGQLVPN